MTPDLETLRIELGDIVDQFTRVARPAPQPTIDTSEVRCGTRPGNRRPRRHRLATVLGLAGIVTIAAGCVLPPEVSKLVDVGTPLSVTDETPDSSPFVVRACHTPDGWAFTYSGPADAMPAQCWEKA